MLAFDIETIADTTAIPLLPPCEAPSNYKDQAKIDAAVAEKTAERNAKLALDPDCCRIVAIGYTTSDDTIWVDVCEGEASEREALCAFWRRWSRIGQRPVGFNCVGFDLPVLIQRSRILGVPPAHLELRKYGCAAVDDLMLSLHHGGLTPFKGLAFWVKRLGLDVPEDTSTGKDVAGFVAADDWEAVKAHCASDVARTLALAQHLGVGR